MSRDFTPFAPLIDSGFSLQESGHHDAPSYGTNPLANIFAAPAPSNGAGSVANDKLSAATTPVAGLPIFSTAATTANKSLSNLNNASASSLLQPNNSMSFPQAHVKVGSYSYSGHNGASTHPIMVSESTNAFTHSSSNSVDSDNALANGGPLSFCGAHPNTAACAHNNGGSAAGATPAPTETVHGTNLYVASLPSTFSDAELYSLFAPFGPIVSSKVMFSKPTSGGAKVVCRGYGFVLFKNEADATRAQAQMIGHIVGGNKIQVRRAKSGSFSADAGAAPSTPAHKNAMDGQQSGGTFSHGPTVSRISSASNHADMRTVNTSAQMDAFAPLSKTSGVPLSVMPPTLHLNPTALMQTQQPFLAQAVPPSPQMMMMPLYLDNGSTPNRSSVNFTPAMLSSPMSVVSPPSGGTIMGSDGQLYVLVPASSMT